MSGRRVLISEVPPGVIQPAKDPWTQAFWRAKWVRTPGDPRPPLHSAYRLRFSLSEATFARIHVAADERYILFLDGERIGRGNDRGDLGRWFFETYELDLAAGRHEIFAHVWSFGDADGLHAQHAQMTLRPGFLLASETHPEVLETGTAPWNVARLEGIESLSPLTAWGIEPRRRFVGEPTNPMGMGRPGEWHAVEVAEAGRSRDGANGVFPSRLLSPTIIPAQRETEIAAELLLLTEPPQGPTSGVPLRANDHREADGDAWRRMAAGEAPFVVPAGERRRVLLKFPTYCCVYPHLRASGSDGASVRIHGQEALFEPGEGWRKGDRNAWEGKLFTSLWHRKDGIGDEFLPRGFKQDFQSFDWIAGRYAEVLLEAGEKSLAIFDVEFVETRYPLDLSGWPSSDDPDLDAILAICRRGAEEACHDMFIDCAYERMQYVFDARIEALMAMVFGGDDRLARKALIQIRDSLGSDGMVASRHPARERQVIPLFGLHFILMIEEFAQWRGDREFVRDLLPAARSVLDHFVTRDFRTPGWNYVDWVASWPGGVPPGADEGRDPIVGMMYLHAALAAGRLRRWVAGEEPAMEVPAPIPSWIMGSEREASRSSEHFAALVAAYPGASDSERGEAAAALRRGEFACRCTFPFTHHLFEAYAAIGWPEGIVARVRKDWGAMVRDGLATPIEHPEPTRSDCHGWSSHPAFHLLTGGLGLRPAGYGAGGVERVGSAATGLRVEGSVRVGQRRVRIRSDGDVAVADEG